MHGQQNIKKSVLPITVRAWYRGMTEPLNMNENWEVLGDKLDRISSVAS